MKQSILLLIITALLVGGLFIPSASSTTTTPSLSRLSVLLDNYDINAGTGEIGLTISAKDANGKGIPGLTPVVTLDPKSFGDATTPIDLGDGTYICSLNGLLLAGSFSVSVSINTKTATAYFKVDPVYVK
jgi:hypothetical protein